MILKEERFQSCMESEQETHWLSMQMLHAVRNTAALPEDVQVEVMRVRLHFITIKCIAVIATIVNLSLKHKTVVAGWLSKIL